MLNKTSLLLALALSAAGVAGVGPALAQEILVPVESFTKQDQFSSPRLSPDGKHVAIKVRLPRNGRLVPTLAVYSLPELKVVSALAMNIFEIPLNFTWATNTRLIITKGIEVGLREAPQATGEVIAVDLDGKHAQYLYGYKADNAATRLNGRDGFGLIRGIPDARNEHVLVGTHRGERSYLYDIDSVKGTRKVVAEIGVKGLNFHSQRDGTPRFAIGADDSNLQIAYRRDDAGNWTQLSKETIGKSFVPLGFSADDSEFYAYVSAKGEPDALIRESLKTGQRTVLAKDERGEFGLQWDERRSAPFAVISQIGIPSVRYLDANSPNTQLHKALSQQFPGNIVNFINFTDDGSKLLFSVASDRDPGSFFLYDKKTGMADLLFATTAEIEPEQMAERRPFSFKARDGVGLYGYLTLPKNADTTKQKLPMVLIPHGGPFGVVDNWYFDADAQFLASRGYAVLQVNFRGSGGRGHGFEESGYKQWGGKIQDDLIDAVKAAILQDGIDEKRICTYGVSFGGYSALMLPAREPDMFKCAVGFAGAYDLAYKFKEYRLTGNKRVNNFFLRTMGGDEAELEPQSPVKLADRIKVPVWLVHGGKDKTVSVEHAKRMREALIKVGRPPEWTLEEDEGHGFYDAQRRKEFYENLEKFLGKHIGKPG